MNHTKFKTAAAAILFLLALIQPVKAQFPKINFSGFYLGTFHFPNIDNYHSYTYLEKLDSLRFNMLMGYTSHQDNDLVCKIWGGFYDSISIYRDTLINIVTSFKQYFGNNNYTLFLEREKILRPAYGQSTRHQAEDNPENNIPGYGFTERHGTTGSEIRDNELIYYRIMRAGTDAAGFCLKELLENNEQVNIITEDEYGNDKDLGYMMSDRKSNQHRWFIKPRIRIDSNYAVNNPDSLVAKIIVLNFSGDTILNQNIKCKHFYKFENNNYYYDGKYHEHFYDEINYQPYFLNVLADSLVLGTMLDEQGKLMNLSSNKIDIQLYWYGKVDMYVDYVKFEDEWAHCLMTDSALSNDNQYFFKQRIQQEYSIFQNISDVQIPYFVIDEYNYNMLPCIAYVDSLVRRNSGNKSGLAIVTSDYWLTDYAASGLKRTPDKRFGYNSGYQFLYDSKAIKDILLTDIYPISRKIPLPPNITLPNVSTFPGTINYRNAANVNDYNDTLIYIIENGIFTSNPNEYCPSFLNRFRKCLYTCKETDINNFAVALPFFTDESDPEGSYSDREPTIEEMNMLSCLALAYNANILLEFSMISRIINEDEPTYFWGLTDVPQYIGSCNFTFGYRFLNYYEQPKWNSVKEIGKRLRAIGEYIFPSDDRNNTKRLNHYKTVTVDTVFKNDQLQEGFFNHLPESYVNDIQSVIYNPQAQSFDVSLQDPSSKRYWELAFFEKRNSEPLDKSKYLFALNKRCVPGELGTGDYRQLRIKFNGNYLSQFKNWLIKDAISDSVINTFPGYSSEYIIAGDFQPGEGKLLKIAPVMQEGGTLVCDESISGCSFICDSTVFNDGFDITINKDVTISFSSKGEIIMEEGEFNCGLDPQMSQGRVEFKGNSANWKGISLTGCDKIEIFESDFKNILYNGNDSTSRNSAVTIINSCDFNINHCNFEMSTSSGGVNIIITDIGDNFEWGNTIVQNSTFTAKNGNNQDAISVTSLAEIITPVRVENCTISADNSETITTGILLTQVIQGSIKNNEISSCLYALDLLNSSADIYENTITCDFENSSGIRGKTDSYLFLNPNDCYYTGGMNSISQIGENNKNIEILDSYFYLDEGFNTLNIGDYYSGDAYYLEGNMPMWTPNTKQTENCFQKEGNNIEIEDTVNVYCCVEDLSGDTIDFTFTPFECDNNELENFIVISFPGIVNDTIYKKSGGMGGGFKSEERNTNMEISPEKLLRDSINLGFRMRNYIQMENQCKRYIGLYPDSVFSIEALQKLYYATIMTDSVNQKTGLLKTYYETLIQNNQSNLALIKRAFYLIQKCKVKLEQYTSALEGFQIIIQSNPYSWEGLLASWDYAATLLKAGQGGAERNMLLTDKNETILLNFEENLDTLINRLRTNDGYDKKVFNQENRKKIYGNIQSALNEEKRKQEEQIRELKEIKEKNIRGINLENGSRGIKTKQLESNLAELEALHKTVKVKKPATIKELNTIIQSDIRSINKAKSKETGETKKAIIPKEYSLSQNYPNPFNPVTKINFALPKEGKVKLVVYDMLGREVARLINNENLSAGTYVREFNGSNLSSGVYFLRILVNDGKDFSDVKKIVLLK